VKLIEIWNAVNTSEEKPVSSWQAVSGLKKSPDLAYTLLTYGPKLGGEFTVIEKYRNELIYECSGAEPGKEVRLEPGTPEYAKFLAEFMTFLNKDSNLEPTGITMTALIADLKKKDGNMVSEVDLMLVAPFFQEKLKPAE